MKLTYISFVLFIWLLMPWSLNATIYLQDNFEDTNNITGVPSGWDNTTGTTLNPDYRWRVYDLGFSGKCLRFNSFDNTSGYTNDLITPEMSIPLGSDATLSFVFKNKDGGAFQVGVLINNEYKVLESGLVAAEWLLKEYQLANYAGSTLRVVFRSSSNYGGNDAYHYLDNVVVKDSPLCPKPINLLLTSLSQSSAYLTWEMTSMNVVPDKFNVTLFNVTDNGSVFVDSVIVASDKSLKLQNLLAGKKYEVQLRSDCQNSYKGYSDWSDKLVFTTPVASVNLPYAENFDAVVGEVPSQILVGDDAVISNTCHSRFNSLKIISSTTKTAFAIFPQISHEANDLQFTAWIRANSNNVKYSIGLISDPADMTSFISVFEDSLVDASVWTEIRVNTADLQITNRNMSFAIIVPDGDNAAIYIDDISITHIPSCPRPERIRISNVDSVSFEIKWDGANASVSEVSLLSIDGVELKTLSNNQGVVSGLKHNTEYTVMVRDICVAGDTSEWSMPKKIRTSCGVSYNPMFSESFEGTTMPLCWVQRQIVAPILGSEGSNYLDNAWTTSFFYKYSGSRALQLKKSKVGTHSLLVAPPIYIDTDRKYDISFWMYRCAYNSIDGEGVTLWVNNSPDTIGAQKCQFVNIDYRRSPIEEAVGWYRYVYNIEKSGVVYIMFDGISKNGMDVYIDDVEVLTAPSCRPVKFSSVSISDLTTSSVSINWNAGDNHVEYALRYSLFSDKDTISDYIIVNNNSEGQQYKISGLYPATRYKLICDIAGICSEGDTSIYVSRSFMFDSQCEVSTLPIFESFEGAGFAPVCWNEVANYDGNFWAKNVDAKYVYSGTSSAKVATVNKTVKSYLVSPRFITNGNDYEVAFSMYRRDGSSTELGADTIEGIRVWLNSVPDIQGATLLSYVKANKNVFPKESKAGMFKYVASFTSTGTKYVIIEGVPDGKGQAVYIDDVLIREKPLCDDMCAFNLSVVAFDAIRVTLENSDINSWSIEYGLKGFVLGTGTLLQASGKYIDIRGLQADTEYDVYVRRACVDSYSAWSKPVSIVTLCSPYNVSGNNVFVEDFESYATDAEMNNCVVEISDIGTPREVFVTNKVGTVSAYSGNNFAYVKSPVRQINYTSVMLHANTDYELSAWVVQSGGDDINAKISLLVSDQLLFSNTNKVVESNTTSQWKCVNGFFNVPADGLYYVGWGVEQIDNGKTICIDNFKLSSEVCVPPSQMSISHVSADTAHIMWMANADKYEILVSDIPLDMSLDYKGVVYHDTIDTNFVTIRGLSDNKEYYAYVRSLCSGGFGAWSAPLSFVTLCNSIKIPYSWHFEDYKLRELLCWTQHGKDGDYKHTSVAVKSGAGALSVSNLTLVTPEIDVAELDDCMISGWVMGSKDSTSFSIGVMTDPLDISTYEPITTINVVQGEKWQEFYSFFSVLNSPDYEAVSGAKYIAIAMTDPSVSYYFDDIVVKVKPSCPSPTEITVSNITDNSFALSWKANASEAMWLLSVTSNIGFALDTVIVGNPFVVSGLKSNTTYAVKLAALCSALDSSAVVNCGEVTTLCNVETLPFVLNLQYEDMNSLPACWSVKESNTYIDEEWAVRSVDNSYAIVYKGWDYKRDYHSTLFTPIVDLTNVKSALLEMKVKNFKSRELIVIIANEDGSVLDSLGYIFPVQDKYAMAELYKFDMSAYVGKKVKIGFKASSGKSYESVVEIQSMMVDVVYDCIMPIDINLVDVYGKSAEFNIVDTMLTNRAWQYVCGFSGFVPTSISPLNTDAKLFKINGLMPNTEYDVYVRSVCDSSSFSRWFGPVSFTTLCDLQNLPFKEGFEEYNSRYLSNPCMTILNDKVQGSYPRAEITSRTYVSKGEKGLKLFSCETEPLFVLLPQFVDSLKTLKLSFDYRNESVSPKDGVLIVGVMNSSVDVDSFVPIHICPQTDKFTNVTIKFDTVSQLLDGYSGRVAFKYQGASDNYYLGIDDVRVSSLTACNMVENIELMSIASDGVTLKLYTENNTSKFQVAYGIDAVDAEHCSERIVSTSDVVCVQNLLPGTTYSIFARSICGVNDTSVWSAVKIVSTPCDIYTLGKDVKYIENFDSLIGGVADFPSCLYRLKTYDEFGVTYPKITSFNAMTGTHCMNLRSENVIVLPKFNNELGRLKITFEAKGDGAIYLGVVSNYDVNNLTILDEFNLSNVRKKCEFDMSYYDHLSADNIVLCTQDRAADLYIDSLVVELAPTCYAPRNVKLLYVADKDVQLFWSHVPDAVKYEYRLVTENDTLLNTTLTDTVCISGLSAASDYVFQVRTYGVNGILTDWSNSVSFRTLPTPAQVPYVADFENIDDIRMWQFVDGDGVNNFSDKFVIGNDPKGVANGERALYVSNDDSTYTYTGPRAYEQWGVLKYDHEAFFAYRTINLNAGQYNLKWTYKGSGLDNQYSSSAFNFGKIFLMPDSIELVPNMIDYEWSYMSVSRDLHSKSVWTVDSATVVLLDSGLYKMVVVWDQKKDPVGGTPLAIDDIIVDKSPCADIVNLRLEYVTANSALLLFDNINDGGVSEYYWASGDTISGVVSIASDSIILTNLEPQTTYTIFVKPSCGSMVGAKWSNIQFVTGCVATVVNAEQSYLEDFESYTDDKAILNVCWKEQSYSGIDKWEVRTAADTYDRSAFEGSNYVSLPRGNNSMLLRDFYLVKGEKYNVSFMAKVKSSNGSRGSIVVRYNGVDTILLQKTFVAQYEKFESSFVPSFTGVYSIGVLADIKFFAQYLSLDNFEVSKVVVGKPDSLTAINITANSVDLVWKNVTDNYQVQIVDNDVVVVDSIVVGNVFSFDRLLSSSLYTAQVRSILGSDTSMWSKIEFVTDCGVRNIPYLESFAGQNQELPYCWKHSVLSTSGKDNWHKAYIDRADVLLVNVSKSYGTCAVLSNPIFVETEYSALSFDYKCTSDYDRLIVLITSDGGVTFADTIFATSKTIGVQSMFYKLNNFVGDTISVAFVVNASQRGDSQYMYVDNFRVNCIRVEEDYYKDSVCPNEVYSKNGFFVEAEKLASQGLYSFTRFIKSDSIGDCDKLTHLDLTVLEGGITYIDTAICQNDVYVSDAFPNGLTESGMYKRILKSSCGCDSVVVLSLRVENSKFEFSREICEGSSFVFGDKDLFESGTYVDTLLSSSMCDSVVTLHLRVLPTEFVYSKRICEGKSYVWEDTILSTSGYYQRVYKNHIGCDSVCAIDFIVIPTNVDVDSTICYGKSVNFGMAVFNKTGDYNVLFENSLGCDSVVNLHLTVLEPDTIDVADQVCEGYKYSGYGYVDVDLTRDTILQNVQKDADGCEMVQRLYIDFIPTITVDTMVSISDGETYLFCGNSLSKSGTYDCTLRSESTGCDSVVHLTLVVTTGVDNVYTLPLVIAPNPVDRGREVVIYQELTSEEQEGVRVEVLDALGRMIQNFVPDSYPIKVSAFDVSGVYTIRIVTGTDKVYQGKVLVK